MWFMHVEGSLTGVWCGRAWQCPDGSSLCPAGEESVQTHLTCGIEREREHWCEDHEEFSLQQPDLSSDLVMGIAFSSISCT